MNIIFEQNPCSYEREVNVETIRGLKNPITLVRGQCTARLFQNTCVRISSEASSAIYGPSYGRAIGASFQSYNKLSTWHYIRCPPGPLFRYPLAPVHLFTLRMAGRRLRQRKLLRRSTEMFGTNSTDGRLSIMRRLYFNYVPNFRIHSSAKAVERQ